MWFFVNTPCLRSWQAEVPPGLAGHVRALDLAGWISSSWGCLENWWKVGFFDEYPQRLMNLGPPRLEWLKWRCSVGSRYPSWRSPFHNCGCDISIVSHEEKVGPMPRRKATNCLAKNGIPSDWVMIQLQMYWILDSLTPHKRETTEVVEHYAITVYNIHSAGNSFDLTWFDHLTK